MCKNGVKFDIIVNIKNKGGRKMKRIIAFVCVFLLASGSGIFAAPADDIQARLDEQFDRMEAYSKNGKLNK